MKNIVKMDKAFIPPYIEKIERESRYEGVLYENYIIANLIPLCGKCHRKAEMGQFLFCQHSRGASDEKEKESSELLVQLQKMLRAEGNKPIRHSLNQTHKK